MKAKTKRKGRIRDFLFFASFIAVVLLLICSERKRIQKREPYRIMPEICALDVFGDSINCNSMLNPEKKTAILFFSPECNACRKEINDIVTFQSEFQDIQWVFITIAQYEELHSFVKECPISSLPDAFLLREDYPTNHLLFDVSTPPALFVYNEKGKLIAMRRGEILLRSMKDL